MMETTKPRNTEQHAGQSELLRVLTYHRVADPDRSSRLHPALISATPADFDRQMQYLSRRFRVVSIDEVLEAIRGSGRLPKKSVLITFDDAYRDLKEYALPILKWYKLPAVIFVPTAFADQQPRSFWWDRLYGSLMLTTREISNLPVVGRYFHGANGDRYRCLRELEASIKTLRAEDAEALVDNICDELGEMDNGQRSVMDWDELRQLTNDGIALGSHARSHTILTQMPLEKVRDEVRRSKEDLEREIEAPVPVFSYPSGSHSMEVVRILREEGYEIAFSCVDGHNKLSSVDPLRMYRTSITRRTSSFIFRMRLLRWITYADRWRHRKKHGCQTQF